MPAATPTPDLLSRPAEKLVITGLRNLMAACELGDMACWDSVWQLYLVELGPAGARRMVGELQYWARALRGYAGRPMAWYPQCCRSLCHDECMALAMVAAAQAADETTLRLAARHLTGQSAAEVLGELWQATLPFAEALAAQGRLMYPVPARVVAEIAGLHQAGQGRAACRLLN